MENSSTQESLNLHSTFNPGLVLIDFRTAQPRIFFNYKFAPFSEQDKYNRAI